MPSSNKERITQDEYFEALEKVNRFHIQLKNDELDAQTSLDKLRKKRSECYIMDLLRKHSTKRTVNALRIFLNSETSYRKIPFSSAASVTTGFFAEKYSHQELKKIRNLGANSLISLTEILQQAGHTLSS